MACVVVPIGFRPPVVLEGRFAALVPMEHAHATDLARAGADPELWRYLPYGPCRTTEEMEAVIATLQDRERAGTDLCFTIVARSGRLPIGQTRFLEFERFHKRAEIGGTWLAPSVQRSPFNTECKRLLLGYAFETEGVHRVQFKTDLRNERSQHAIERLGARREGVLRDHMVMPDGFVRSGVLYSLVASEWPSARARLDAMLQRTWSTAL